MNTVKGIPMEYKKRIILLLFLLLIFYLQFFRPIHIISSSIYSSSNECEQNFTINANKLFILNKESFAKKLLNQYQTDSLHKIKLSRDLATSRTITFNVYVNSFFKLCNHINFTINYSIDSNDKYTLTLN